MPPLTTGEMSYAEGLQPFMTGPDASTPSRPPVGNYAGALQPFLSNVGDAALKYLRWNLMGSPGLTPGDLGYGAAKSVVDTGRMMTTPPMQPPAGSSTDDSGRIGFARGGEFVPLQDVDPQAARSYYGSQTARVDLAPRIAVGLLGGGSGFSPRGAVGMAGGRLTQAEMDALRDARFANKLKDDPNPTSLGDILSGPARAKEDIEAGAARLQETHRQLAAETAGRVNAMQRQNIAQAEQIGGNIGSRLKSLYEAGTDRGKFDVAFQALREDKSISASDLRTISQTYGNHVSKGSKDAMLDEIEKAFIREARFMNKIGQ